MGGGGGRRGKEQGHPPPEPEPKPGLEAWKKTELKEDFRIAERCACIRECESESEFSLSLVYKSNFRVTLRNLGSFRGRIGGYFNSSPGEGFKDSGLDLV